MKVSESLKKEIANYFCHLKNYSQTMRQITGYDNFFIEQEYLKKKTNSSDNSYLVPTEKLLFLAFEEFDNLIKAFLLKNNIGSVDEINSNDDFKRFAKKFCFYYEKLRNNFGFELQKENEIYICPYCEKNYVNLVETKDGSRNIKPDLDHYYPKSLYPFLACSIENLIPACQVCNSRLKRDVDFYRTKHIHPLKDRFFERIKFNYNAGGIIYVENNLSFNKNEKNYLNTFRIQEIYSTHNEIKDDLKTKFDKYNKIKRKHLIKSCPSFNEYEILEMVFYEYKNENKKHPLRKLKKDLFEIMKEETLDNSS